MSWWKKALIASVIWLVAVVAAGYVHTDVILAGRVTQAEDEAISEMYGFAFALGLVVLWGIAFLITLLAPRRDRAA